jgi:hypothetical protein
MSTDASSVGNNERRPTCSRGHHTAAGIARWRTQIGGGHKTGGGYHAAAGITRGGHHAAAGNPVEAAR